MFAQLKSIVDLIRSGVTDFRKFKSDKERGDAIVGLLKAYFLLKDCVDESEALIAEAGPEPVAQIERLEAADALSTLERWDAVIRRQGMRLYTLQGYIFAQDHLSVINPELQERISDVIGYKMDRAVTLHGIGSALFFRSMFPVADTNAEKARYVSLMAGAEDDILDMAKIADEIAELRKALEQYREVIDRLVSSDELLRLSSRARNETLFRDGA